ncbi:MAG TPA: tetratricopeptide repeat protein [Pirellulaceae bacterium]|nr:tetratricopeptide repeat protein [Pirellulaceae bacterium]
MKVRIAFGLAALVAIGLQRPGEILARGGLGGVGGGGGRGGGGGMSRGGGGMSRPSGGMSRPSGGLSRPSGGMSHNINRPSMGSVSRPSAPSRPSFPGGGAQRPSLPGGGNLGGFSPSGGRPSTRPSTPQLPRPQAPGGGIANRPSINPPGDLRPATRPSLPGAGGGSRPSLPGGIADNRPSLPGGNRPSIGNIDRPTTLPGVFPGGGERPNRPDRPVIGGGGDRPLRPDRPIIGGGNNNIINRPGNINIGNDVNIGNNLGNWGINNRPGGDWWSQNHNWHDHWNNGWIHDHHDWYHGCWHGNWGVGWYAPFVWGTAAWGSWGYGPTYYNPYYVESTSAPPYDYSQPVVLNNYVTSDASGGAADATGGAAQAAQQDSPETQQALKLFDDGLAAFKSGGYAQALAKMDAALKLMPTDPVLHEVRALCLFALGRYDESAATLNALLATAPGMDWTSMSALYGNPDDYTAQLRKLEAYVKANRTNAGAIFVLAYHYLVIGQNDEAIKALREVVRLQPKDTTAQRMLGSLAPPEEKPAETTPPPAAPENAPTTDLVGTWRASSGDAVIELTIDDQFNFTWKATPKGKPAVEVKGTVNASSDSLALETKDQGNMVGQVKSGGPDKFTFAMQGLPPGDPGLEFARAG